VGLLGQLTLPTGQYDSGQILNMGANRVALRVGLPTAYYIGDSFLDPRLTTLELLPSITFYGDNPDAPGSASTTSQDLVFMLEGHLTHNLNRAMWLSLDALYTTGGETETDGVSNDDSPVSFAMGVTANLNFSTTASLKVSYGETIWASGDGPDGEAFRAVFSVSF